MHKKTVLGFLLGLLFPTLAFGATATLTGTLLRADGSACSNCSVVITAPTTQVVDGDVIPKGRQFSFRTEADGDVPSGETIVRTAVVIVEVEGDVRAQVSVPDTSTVDISALIANTFAQAGLSLVDCQGATDVLRFDLASSSFICQSISVGGDITDVWGCTSGNCSTLTAASGDSYNAEAADSTAPMKSGTSAPGTCQAGDFFFDTDATAGRNTYACTSANTWTLQGDGGGASVALDDLTDVTITAAASNDFLKYNGSAWVDDPIDLGTDTTGNYAGAGSEGGSATSAVKLDDADYGDVTSASGTVTVDTGAVAFSELSGQAGDAQIADGAVDGGTGGEIADASITAADLATDSVSSDELNATGVEAELEAVLDLNELQGQLGDAQIADGAVDGGTGGEIADASITAADLATDSVSSDELNATGVEAELEAVLDLNELQGQLVDAQIADGAVDGGTGGEIADASITAADLATDSVSSDELNATGVEAELEAVLDLDELQGAVTDSQVPNTVTIDLAAAATALAGNGNNCSSGQAPLGVDTAGASESCFDVATQTEFDALAEGYCWQGNGTGSREAMTIPIGRDIRTTDAGAACDGASDESDALQEALDENGQAWVPAGCTLRINTDIVLSSGDKILCGPGSVIRMGTGITTAGISGSGIDGFRMQGCTINVDQIEKDAIRCTSNCENFVVRDTDIWWNLDADTPITPAASLDYIDLDCKDAAAGDAAGCLMENVRIIGSGVDGQEDTGLRLAGGCGFVGYGAALAVRDVVISSTGDDAVYGDSGCVQFDGALLYDCRDICIAGVFSQSTFSDTIIAPNSSDGDGYGLNISSPGGNNVFTGLQFPDPVVAGKNRMLLQGSGNSVSGSYIVDGVTFDAPTDTTTLGHNRIFNVVMGAGQCDAFGNTCLLVENPGSMLIHSLTVVGAFGTSGGDVVRIENDHTGGTEMKQIIIADSLLTVGGNATGVQNGINFVGAGTATGFLDVTIANNVFGGRDVTALDNAIVVTTITDAASFTASLTGNTIVNATTAVSGVPTGSAIASSGNVGIPPTLDHSTTATAISDEFTITCSREMVYLNTAAGATIDSAATAIADGTFDGQECTIVNVDSADAMTFDNGANTDLGAATRTLNSGGMLTVVWVNALSNWSEKAFSAN